MKVGFDIETYKTRFLGGARSYLFFCFFQFPSIKRETDTKVSLFGKGTQDLIERSQQAQGIFDEEGAATMVDKMNAVASGTIGVAKNALTTFGLGAKQDMVSYLVKATSIPGSSFDEVTVDLQGYPVKFAGNKVYDDWSVTFNIDEKADILRKFHDWQNYIQNPKTGQRISSKKYMMNQEIHLIDYTGNTIQTFKLIGAWPKVISQVSLDYSANEIAQVEITFAYQYYIAEKETATAKLDLIKRGAQRLMGMI